MGDPVDFSAERDAALARIRSKQQAEMNSLGPRTEYTGPFAIHRSRPTKYCAVCKKRLRWRDGGHVECCKQ